MIPTQSFDVKSSAAIKLDKEWNENGISRS